jgi:hypothetical protein
MLKTIPLSCIILLCISCTRYQYTTLSSSSTATNDKLEFVAENDSLRLVYNFYGQNAPINITIQNKLQVPVYVDWQRSALVVNDHAISYVPNEMKIQGAFYSESYNSNYRGSSFGMTSGSIDATASLPRTFNIIPPQTYITNTPMGVTNKLIENVPDTAYHRVNYTMIDGYSVPVKMATFTEATSPLRFKSYITLMVGDSTSKPVAIEHTFYVSELITTSHDPESMWLTSAYRGNQFYLKEQTGYGKTMYGFGVIMGNAVYAATVESMYQVGNNIGNNIKR